MSIKSKSALRKPEINLSGPDGNAYVLLGYASSYCKELNIDFEPVRKKMTSSDYENLIKVFDSYFGNYVDLVR
jgi:hypothetical protein